jgi:uncharacterized protein (DUF305 family)
MTAAAVLAAGWAANAPQSAAQQTMMHGQAMQGQGTQGQGMMGGMMDMMRMMPMMQMMQQSGGDEGVASLAYRGANMKMHRDMAVTYTGDADVDFVKSMIPHHRGAIDMAKIVLVFGKDPEVKKLAEAVVKAQEEEVATMEAWLKKNAK